MLHYYGNKLAMELGQAAKTYIPLYEKKGEEICKVAFFDLEKKRKRFVKFQKLEGQWVFVDLVD
jgi:uncharacterized protein YkuJ